MRSGHEPAVSKLLFSRVGKPMALGVPNDAQGRQQLAEFFFNRMGLY